MNEKIKVSTTARIMRKIDWKGGFDNYMLETSDKLLTHQLAKDLKLRIERALIENSKLRFHNDAQ